MRDPNSIISDVSAWSRVAELATRSTEHALLTLAAAQPIPTLPLDDAEQRSDILLVELLRERDHVRRALALVEQLLGADWPD
ncbi:hypothetical protein G6321_00048600 [Bradyrhizobium barranii subsp. barranii]|uniref:Uncharacterized protein n=1 Tax=Bradyrhizobium barranii subsp. barranii TaxID=2823807 RepID=A0A7Z0Q9Z4_9BRAD|nr:hypothetical protein [Bradyrhizobium barranii]UGX93381.1 hypothetical protein G6321_00048600 [Bradyrhizobium barranii subsp. barranii]